MCTTTLDAAQRKYDNMSPADDLDVLEGISDFEYRKLQRKLARLCWESIIADVLEQVDLLPAFEAGPVSLGSLFHAAIGEQLNDRIVAHIQDEQFKRGE